MINRVRLQANGFTLVETLIVLTVTMALLSSAILLFRQRVPRTQFSNSISELETYIQDTYAQVVSGNYVGGQNFECTNGDLNAGSAERGESSSCIYLGQAMQMGASDGSSNCSTSSPGDGCDKVIIYSVTGARDGISGIATTLEESGPRVSTQFANTDFVNGYGTYVTSVSTVDSLGNRDKNIGGFAFVQTFGTTSAGSTEVSGAPQVNLIPLQATTLGMTKTLFSDSLVASNKASGNGFYSPVNPIGGVRICLRSAATDQYAMVTVGVNQVVSQTSKTIYGSQASWNSAGCV